MVATRGGSAIEALSMHALLHRFARTSICRERSIRVIFCASLHVSRTQLLSAFGNIPASLPQEIYGFLGTGNHSLKTSTLLYFSLFFSTLSGSHLMARPTSSSALVALTTRPMKALAKADLLQSIPLPRSLGRSLTSSLKKPQLLSAFSPRPTSSGR